MVEQTVRQRIADGTYRPGTRIPPLPTLAAELDVSVRTLRDGLQPLKDEGLLIVTYRETTVSRSATFRPPPKTPVRTFRAPPTAATEPVRRRASRPLAGVS
jgi:DNA-binding GntR family transcriptional regulator